MNMKKILRKTTWYRFKKLIHLYLIYVLILGFLVFLKDYKTPSSKDLINLDEYYYSEVIDKDINNDRAAIIEDRDFALTSRFRLLDEAENSVKILNYGMYEGEVCELFLGKILQTADRGVKIQIVFDGLVNNLHGPLNQKKWAIVNHPNIEVKFYDKPNLLKPWTIQNRLHDKIWIVDNKFALSGGRNIDDRFYLNKEKLTRAVVNDRDVLVWNRSNKLENSSISEFDDYFEKVWNHPYSKTCKTRFKDYLGKEKRGSLLTNIQSLEKDENVSWLKPIDWMELSYPTNKISLVTNPLERFKKEPIVLKTLAEFFKEADKVVIAQTPYAIYNEELQQFIKSEDIKSDFHLLTNSIYSSPNLLAMGGTEKYKNELSKLSNQIYRYQGDGSIHAKSYIIDDNISIIGSFNLDPRSAFLSTENIVIIHSEEFNTGLSNNIMNIMENSSIDLDGESLSVKNKGKEDISSMKSILFKTTSTLFYPFDELL